MCFAKVRAKSVCFVEVGANVLDQGFREPSAVQALLKLRFTSVWRTKSVCFAEVRAESVCFVEVRAESVCMFC